MIEAAQIDEFNIRFDFAVARTNWGGAKYDLWLLQTEGQDNGIFRRQWKNRHTVDSKDWTNGKGFIPLFNEHHAKKLAAGYRASFELNATGENSITLAELLNIHIRDRVLDDRMGDLIPSDCPLRRHLMTLLRPLRTSTNNSQWMTIEMALGLAEHEKASDEHRAPIMEAAMTAVLRNPAWGLWS